MSSIIKKQIVAVTGLLLIVYIIAHLAGNLFILAGPKAFNGYAQRLEEFGILLYIAEAALTLVFVLHIWLTASLVLENIKARGGMKRYAVDRPVGNRSLATRLMPYSGTYIFLFVLWHLLDFKFVERLGPRSVIAGKSYGLFGIVANSFIDPLHSTLYIIAMCFLGLHLAHGTDSVIQTFGFHGRFTSTLQKFSRGFALFVAAAFSSIPIYILIKGTASLVR